MTREEREAAIAYIKSYRKLDEELHNTAPKDSISYYATDKCLKYWDMAIKALEKENIYDDKEHYVTISKALYDKLNIDYEALEQEPCDKCVYSTKDGCCQYEDIAETIPPFEPCEVEATKLQQAYNKGFEDCRQAALNSLIDNTDLEGYDLAEALDAIENKEKLPPVTQKPETVTEFADRCRECGARYGKLLKQKSGKWLYKEITDDYRVTGQCSECRERRIIDNFCPNCGVKMQEAKNES